MNLYIHQSNKIDFNKAEDALKIVDSMKQLDDEFDYLIFTDYEGIAYQRFSMALTDPKKDDTVPLYIDPSIQYLAIKFTHDQMPDILSYAYKLDADGTIKRAYTIDYIKKRKDFFEFYVSIK